MEVIGARLSAGESSSGDIFKRVEEYRRNSGDFVQLFNHEVVVGREHLLWAHEKARYSMENGNNRGDTLEMETLLWAAGERQIKNAIGKMGLQDNAVNVVVMVDDPVSFLRFMGWERDDTILEPSVDKLLALGVTMEEIETTHRPYDLVFEYMATSVV